MAKYFPEAPPFPVHPSLQELSDYVFRELNRVSVSLFTEVSLNLEKMFVEPSRPQDGDVVYADGTSWNPGSGAGVYAYLNGSWTKLNVDPTDDLVIDDLTADDITADDVTFDTITLSGGQLVFPAVQNASAGANTLDDYEEGTYTPTFRANGSAAGVTYSTQTGIYTKTGRQVDFASQIILTNNGSGAGTVDQAGQPFNPVTTNWAVVMVPNAGFAGLTGAVCARVVAGANTVELSQMAATGRAVLTDAEITNTGNFSIAGTYATS